MLHWWRREAKSLIERSFTPTRESVSTRSCSVCAGCRHYGVTKIGNTNLAGPAPGGQEDGRQAIRDIRSLAFNGCRDKVSLGWRCTMVSNCILLPIASPMAAPRDGEVSEGNKDRCVAHHRTSP